MGVKQLFYVIAAEKVNDKRIMNNLRNGFVFVFIALLMMLPAAASAQEKTIKQQMEWLHNNRNVKFVYDASLNVNRQYKGPDICRMRLKQAVAALFKGTDIDYDIKGSYILLTKKERRATESDKVNRQKKDKAKRNFTLSGHVKDENGETLINATVYDITSGAGTMTNAYGFFSITLPEGSHRLRCSYVGFDDKNETLELNENSRLDICMHENASLGEVVVTGDMNSPLLNTQTGKRSLGKNDIKTEYSLLSSPDVVKTLQRISGVAEGIELASGLYVHGGNNDENLYLIDGTPLYQINHTMGLFSAFNTDVVKNVDFYKSGFPARYGGRLSSVVDVRTNDGDFYHTHGSYRIGLLDGSFQIEGPIRKGKTSFNFGLRRSWIDLLTRPIFSIANRRSSNDKLNVEYFFHDMNAKVTNIFSDRSRLSLSIYSGQDKLNVKDEYKDDTASNSYVERDVTKDNFSWGNLNMALNWNYQFSPKLFSNFTAVYTYNQSKLNTYEDDRVTENNVKKSVSHNERGYKSSINDFGYRMTFDYRPTPKHHIRFGSDYTWHTFHPQTRSQHTYSGDETKVDTVGTHSRNSHTAHEWNMYAEDEMTLNDHWSMNGGVNQSLFKIGSKVFSATDPRFAIKFQPYHKLSFKASYTWMTQFVHKISNSFLDLPTDYWVPTTENLQPMRSWQMAAGVYFQPDKHWFLSLEGYYKQSRHLLQYASWSGLEPPAERWDKMVMDGRGRFYGAEFDLNYTAKHLVLQGSYTLSWNERKYDDFYPNWYYDKFDNRHKINISARWKISDKVSMFADWNFHTGNNITVPTQYVNLPDVPDGRTADYDNIRQHDNNWENTFAYEKPNNFKLPAYHRLDLGFDFRHTTKHGHERIWNLSFYNLYCHLNSIWVDIDQKYNGQFRIKNHAFIPVVPSFSYTIKF